MPFIEQQAPGGPWTRKTRVGLTQVEGLTSKTYFEFTENFAYTTSAPSPSAGDLTIYDPPLADLIVRKSLDLSGERRVAWQSDLASIPKFLWALIPSYGRHTIPALMHDALCDEVKELSGKGNSAAAPRSQVPKHPYKARRMRRRADKLFRITLADVAGMKPATRWLMWTAVRLFGVMPLAITLVVTEVLVLVLCFTEASPWIGWVSIPLFAAAAMLALRASWEFPEDLEWDLYAKEVGKFQPDAFRSLVGASLIGAAAVFPLAPLIIITLASKLVLLGLDYLFQEVLLGIDYIGDLIEDRGRAETGPDIGLATAIEPEPDDPSEVSRERIAIPPGPNGNTPATSAGDD